MSSRIIGFIAVVLCAWPYQLRSIAQTDEYRYQRLLRDGETLTYEIRAQAEGKAAVVVAAADVKTIRRADRSLAESVRWISITGGDGQPRKLPQVEYPLSENPRRFVAGLGDADTIGMVTDLYTLFFAVSPLIGSTQVAKVGDRYTRPDVVTGNWSDGKLFLVGEDRLSVTVELKSLEPTRATYVTAFAPPMTASPMHAKFMDEPVCGPVPNNFQMVRRQGTQYFVVWGCEHFTVTSVVDRASGTVVSSAMDNLLRWRLRLCTDENLTACSTLPEVARRRTVGLRPVAR